MNLSRYVFDCSIPTLAYGSSHCLTAIHFVALHWDLGNGSIRGIGEARDGDDDYEGGASGLLASAFGMVRARTSGQHCMESFI